jgi:hypothetical protein
VDLCGKAFEGARRWRLGRSRLQVSSALKEWVLKDIPGDRCWSLGGNPFQARGNQLRDKCGRFSVWKVFSKFPAIVDLEAVVRCDDHPVLTHFCGRRCDAENRQSVVSVNVNGPQGEGKMRL